MQSGDFSERLLCDWILKTQFFFCQFGQVVIIWVVSMHREGFKVPETQTSLTGTLPFFTKNFGCFREFLLRTKLKANSVNLDTMRNLYRHLRSKLPWILEKLREKTLFYQTKKFVFCITVFWSVFFCDRKSKT